jgi:hypothetical protein
MLDNGKWKIAERDAGRMVGEQGIGHVEEEGENREQLFVRDQWLIVIDLFHYQSRKMRKDAEYV